MLVGRSGEIEAVADAVQAARHGESRTVAVIGDAGIGKSS